MNEYLQWNDALADQFFNPGMAGRRVHLYVNQKLISDMEQELKPEVGPFLAAVQDGPTWATRQGICQRALQAYQNWRIRNLAFPPYLAYLALFVLSGGSDGNFASHAYYPRLRKLLDDPGEGMLPSFQYMWQLWEDLEAWSVLDQRGDLGVFQARIVGEHIHIGHPLAQSIVTEQERKALPRVFYDAELDPTFSPPADELARALRSPTARSLLRPRTIQLVENQHDTERLAAILDTVADELAEWDGKVEEASVSGYGARLASASLRICLSIDRVTRSAEASVRCKVNREFPEDGLLLNVPGLDSMFRAEEYLEGWSLPISDYETGEVINASELDWHNGVAMRSTSPNWHLRLHGRPVRVFLHGLPEGLPGLVETRSLPSGQPFYLAYSLGSWSQLGQWVTGQCRGFRELDILQGLPRSWRLAKVDEAKSDEAIKDELPFLSFPPSVRLRFVGGIRSSRGSNFFNFAPPSVMVHGKASNLDVLCNDLGLTNGSGGLLTLPQNLQTESRIVIKARSGNSDLDRLSLFLTGDFHLLSPDEGMFLGSTGSKVEIEGDIPAIAGALIRGHLPMEPRLMYGLLEDLEAQVGNIKGFLIGRMPGQIVERPSEPFPTNWRPIWAITKKGRRMWEALFIGDSLENASPSQSVTGHDGVVHEWKRILWYRRKWIWIAPPVLPTVRALWKQFQQVARHV